MTTKDGQVEWKIKDGRTHHMCGEIVALVTTPPPRLRAFALV